MQKEKLPCQGQLSVPREAVMGHSGSDQLVSEPPGAIRVVPPGSEIPAGCRALPSTARPAFLRRGRNGLAGRAAGGVDVLGRDEVGLADQRMVCGLL